jgi:hypothetical protein
VSTPRPAPSTPPPLSQNPPTNTTRPLRRSRSKTWWT